MKKTFKYWIAIIGVILAIGVGGTVLWYQQQQPGKLDNFARCLKEKGEIFYGAFWCPHCQAQKALFASSARYLPYVECSTPDGSGQLQTCINAKVTVYPTWQFSDGSRQEGEATLQELSDKSGCALSQ